MHAKTHLNKLNYGALVDHLLKDKLMKCFVVSSDVAVAQRCDARKRTDIRDTQSHALLCALSLKRSKPYPARSVCYGFCLSSTMAHKPLMRQRYDGFL